MLDSNNVMAERGRFYLKGSLNINKPKDTKQVLLVTNSPKIKSKAKFDFNGAIGGGYYINDFLRTDLTFDYMHIDFKAAMNKTESGTILTDSTLCRDANIYATMLNGYTDFTLNNIQLFLGAGVGISRITEELEIRKEISDNGTPQSDTVVKFPKKTKSNFAYSLMLGTAIKLTKSANLDITYSWKNFGKTGSRTASDGNVSNKNYYKTHNISLGLRLDI